MSERLNREEFNFINCCSKLTIISSRILIVSLTCQMKRTWPTSEEKWKLGRKTGFKVLGYLIRKIK